MQNNGSQDKQTKTLPQRIDPGRVRPLSYADRVIALARITSLLESTLERLAAHYPELKLKTFRMSDLQRIAATITNLPASEQPNAGEMVKLLQTLTADPPALLQSNPISAALDIGNVYYRALTSKMGMPGLQQPQDAPLLRRFANIHLRLRGRSPSQQSALPDLPPVVDSTRLREATNGKPEGALVRVRTVEAGDAKPVIPEVKNLRAGVVDGVNEPLTPPPPCETAGQEALCPKDVENPSEVEMLRRILDELAALKAKLAGLDDLRKAIASMDSGLSGLSGGMSHLKNQIIGLEARLGKKL